MSDAPRPTTHRSETPSFPDLSESQQAFLRSHGFDTVLGYLASFEARVDANTEAFRETRRDWIARDKDRDAFERGILERLEGIEATQREILSHLVRAGAQTAETALTVARASLNDAEEAKPTVPVVDSDAPPPEVARWLRVLPRSQRERARQTLGFIILAVLALIAGIITKLGGEW